MQIALIVKHHHLCPAALILHKENLFRIREHSIAFLVNHFGNLYIAICVDNVSVVKIVLYRSILLLTLLFVLLTLHLGRFKSLGFLCILEILQVLKRHRSILHIAIHGDHCRAITIISKYFVGMLVAFCVRNGKRCPLAYRSVYDSCLLAYSLLLCISNRLIPRLFCIDFLTQSCEMHSITMLYLARFRVVVQYHIIALRHIDGAILVYRYITADDIHTIVFLSFRCLNGRIAHRTPAFVGSHISLASCFLCRLVYLVISIVYNTLIFCVRCLIVIDKVVELIILACERF